MPKINDFLADPEFDSLTEQEQIEVLSQADDAPRLGSEGKESQQNLSKKTPIVASPAPKTEAEKKTKFQRFTDNFGPTALLKGESSKSLGDRAKDAAAAHLGPVGIGVKQAYDAAPAALDRATRQYERTMNSDSLLGAFGRGALIPAMATPILGDILDPMVEWLDDGNPDAKYGVAGQAANLLLPKMSRGTSRMLRGSAERSITKALNPHTQPQFEAATKAAGPLLDTEGASLFSLTRKGLRGKLKNKAGEARNELQVQKDAIPASNRSSLRGLIDDIKKFAQGGKYRSGEVANLERQHEILNESAPVRKLAKSNVRKVGNQHIRTTDKPFDTDLQVLKEMADEKAARGSAFDNRQSGHLSYATEVNAKVGNWLRTLLGEKYPALGKANERMSSLLNANDAMGSDAGYLREAYAAPPAQLSYIRSPVRSFLANIVGEKLAALGQHPTALTSGSAVLKNTLSKGVGAVGQMSPLESSLLSNSTVTNNEQPLDDFDNQQPEQDLTEREMAVLFAASENPEMQAMSQDEWNQLTSPAGMSDEEFAEFLASLKN
jgi:hypothetical protein